MARLSALLFISGASLGLLSLMLPGDPGRNAPAIIATALIAYATAGVPLIGSDRLPLWTFHLLTVAGTMLISVALLFGGHDAHVYGLLYFWVVIYVSYFFSAAASALHLALVGAAYAAVLLARTSPGLTSVSWVITIGTLTVAATLILLLTARLAAVVDDLTSSEAAARASGDRLHALIDAAPVAIIELDTARRVRTWNRAAERIFGWPAGQILGLESPIDLDSDTGPAAIGREPPPARAQHVETVGRRLDGEPIDIALSTAPVLDHAGTQTGAMMIASDMTDQKHLEEQLRHSQKMEAVGRLAGGIAHDFNNILLVVRSYAWLLSESVADTQSEQHENLAEIEKAVDRAASLTRQLLTFSQRPMGQVTVVDLTALITGMEGMLRPLIGEDIELTVDSDEAQALVMADSSQLEQVVVNLVVNAREAMSDGGRLTVTIRGPRDADAKPPHPRGHSEASTHVTLAVTDIGNGISPDQQRLIFEPFYSTKRHTGGSGLGLSTVYGIVEANGGYIEVTSQPGRGTTFTIHLPRAERPLAPRPPETVPHTRMRGSETLMLVEDEDAVREPLRRALIAYGYSVLAAADGEQALHLAEHHPGTIHLLVTDVVMPTISGPDLVQRLTRRRPGIRVLYISGYVERSLELIGANQTAEPPVAPIAGFLQKPFAPQDLATEVRALLDQTTPPPALQLPKAA